MTQTITTPITHKFNSFEALRDSALPLGTKATITLTNGDVISFDLAHKNAYGATNIFVIADCYGEHCMNSRLTNKGGWNMSEMRQHLREDILPLLPTDLKRLIIPRTILQKLDGEIVEPKNGPDLIWLPSFTEMAGLDADGKNKRQCEVDVNDVHFDLYDTEKSRVKELDPHGTWWYWLRSATASNTTDFEHVFDIGNIPHSHNAGSAHGVCFGFCI